MTADELLDKLDGIAGVYDFSEYGLPMGDQTSALAMREVVAAFAAGVARKERDACAKIADADQSSDSYLGGYSVQDLQKFAADRIAAAIRKRGRP